MAPDATVDPRTERLIAARARCPDRFVDVHFHELREDPIRVLHRIGERTEAPVTPTDERAVHDWLAANPARTHGYEAAQFGLSDAGIRERYAEYVERFDVRIEG